MLSMVTGRNKFEQNVIHDMYYPKALQINVVSFRTLMR